MMIYPSFSVLPLKNIPNSKTKVEWIWVLSPTPLLDSLQINPYFAANTCYQSLAFCLVSTQALAQLHKHTCLLRILSVLACTRLYCHNLPTISIHLFFSWFHFLLPCTKLGITQGSILNSCFWQSRSFPITSQSFKHTSNGQIYNSGPDTSSMSALPVGHLHRKILLNLKLHVFKA